jgi:hypothetical protein
MVQRLLRRDPLVKSRAVPNPSGSREPSRNVAVYAGPTRLNAARSLAEHPCRMGEQDVISKVEELGWDSATVR